MPTPELRAVVLTAMVFAVVSLSFSAIFITKLTLAGVQPLAIAFYRMALATALLFPPAVLLTRREIANLSKRDFILLGLGGLFLAVHFWAWISCLKHIPIATAVVLINSHPLFVVIASSLFLGEKPTRRGLTGTLIGLGGMAVIGQEGLSDFDVAMTGNALAVLGAIAVVGYFIIGRYVRARVSLLGYVTPLYAFCTIFLLLWVLASGDRLYPYSTTVWLYFLALAVVPTIFGHTVFNWAVRYVTPTAISVAFLFEPVVASLLAFIFFDQTPPRSTLAGGALVLAGIYLTTSPNRARSVQPRSADAPDCD